jgi:hypothetical protein
MTTNSFDFPAKCAAQFRLSVFVYDIDLDQANIIRFAARVGSTRFDGFMQVRFTR